MPNVLSTVYHGHRDAEKRYSLVVRHGTFGETRERTERMLLSADTGPFRTKSEAVAALLALPEEALRPFVDISRFGGYA